MIWPFKNDAHRLGGMAHIICDGQPHLVEVLMIEGQIWLCPQWRAPNKLGQQLPERLIPIAKIQYRPALHKDYQYRLEAPLPMSALWGKPSQEDLQKYGIRLHPDSPMRG